MKILLVSNYLPDRQASMLRYSSMLERELNKRGHEARVVHPPTVLLKLLGERTPMAKWIAYLDKYIFAREALRAAARWADVVHVCDHSNAMYLPLAGPTPAVITCHDLLAVFAAQDKFPGIVISSTGRLLQRWIATSLLRAREVICVSHKTAEDLRSLGHGRVPRSVVVHNPLNWDFHPVGFDQTRRVLDAKGLFLEGAYLIHIGSNSWYKNRPAVIRIFAALKRSQSFAGTRLLMAGKPWDEELQEAVAASGVAADIFELNDVSDEELRALYSGATALLFPSRYEGFGWPILEAQACGCPVITTDHAPMTEVAGGAAILIDPDEPEAAAARILGEVEHLPQLRAKGLANAELFSVDRAIDQYIAAYELAIEEQGAARA